MVAYSGMASHKRLLAWKECHQLVLSIYQITEKSPKHELYGLTSQTRRAAFSAAVNIVEGAARKGIREFKRFLSISLASRSRTDLEVAARAFLTLRRPAASFGVLRRIA